MTEGAKGNEFLQSVEEEVQAEVQVLFDQLGLLRPDERDAIAARIGTRVADYMAFAWGGLNVYIAKDNHRRAAMMVAEFNGKNHAELALKYGVCQQTVYKILKREREARKGKERQPGNLLDYC